MLTRRGFHPTAAPRDLPFPPELDEQTRAQVAARLGHYAFRLFLRGAIEKSARFTPAETTRFLRPSAARKLAEELVSLGLAARTGANRYRLTWPARNFGGTLEWYVAHELRRRFGFDVATGLKFGARGVGGDLDVVAAAEGKLVYLELKSSPPKHLTEREVGAFVSRLRALRPDVALFVVDTALRLSDKVLPMLVAGLERYREDPMTPRRVERELWALTPHVYAVNAKPDLLANIGRAIAQGFLALGP